jgi:dipeptidyl aminopeptidase/acylaminoacyl peptidase
VYFRWREDPEPDQHSSTDPWYAASRDGRHVRQVPDSEVVSIPTGSIEWSLNRQRAAWSNGGNLFVWDARDGTRIVHTAGGSLGNVLITPDGARVFFATQGVGFQSQEQADLWVYDVSTERTAQQATVFVRSKDDESESDEWLEAQQLELLEFIRRQRRDRETADSVQRFSSLPRPQAIPVEKGTLIRNIQLSPDGRHLTFMSMKDPSREHRTSYLEYINESGEATARDARPKVGAPRATYRLGIVAVEPTVERDSIEVRWVTHDTGDSVPRPTIIHGPYWSPTGEAAVLQILSLDHKDRWIAWLNLEDTTTTIIDHQREDTWIGGPTVNGRWSPGYLQWLPDGSGFGFTSAATGWSMLYLADRDGNVTQLTNGDWEVRRVSLSPDGRRWYLETSMEHPGETHLYHMDVRGGDLERVTMGEGVHRSYVSPDGRRVTVTFATPKQMPDLYLLDNRPHANKTRITKSGTDEFYRYAWIDSEIISFPDIYAHGCGECAQAVDKGWSRIGSVVYANYLHQLGYRSASIDYRGSSGYGHANRTYGYRNMGVRDIDSGLPLLDILAERYGVDRDRIGVYGGSYGGFFTLMSLLRNPGAYAAGVALYPVTDWAHYNDGYTSRILNGTPVDDEEAYRVSSPIYYAEQLADPLMIQHGLVDGNVQIQDSFRFAQALMELGKDFDLVVYPVEPHGWRQGSSRRDSYRRMTRWWDMHLLGQATSTDGGGER